MNQDQRKFLIEQVQKTCRNEAESIEAGAPTRPSLNNYLVAACLDNTLQLQNVDVLKEKIRQSVLKFGKDDLLIEETDEDGFSRRRGRYGDKYKQKVSVEAADIFVIPDDYLKALAEYEEKKKRMDEQLKNLYAQRDTIIMKIQIGSNQVLDKLVMQIDSMGDLNLMNSQLMLGTSEPINQK